MVNTVWSLSPSEKNAQDYTSIQLPGIDSTKGLITNMEIIYWEKQLIRLKRPPRIYIEILPEAEEFTG